MDDVMRVLRRVKKCTSERYVILNIGYTDIKQPGITVDVFARTYTQLVRSCEECDLIPIVSLIMPRDSADLKIIKPYNDYLSNTYKVIDINGKDFGKQLKELIKECVFILTT